MPEELLVLARVPRVAVLVKVGVSAVSLCGAVYKMAAWGRHVGGIVTRSSGVVVDIFIFTVDDVDLSSSTLSVRSTAHFVRAVRHSSTVHGRHGIYGGDQRQTTDDNPVHDGSEEVAGMCLCVV